MTVQSLYALTEAQILDSPEWVEVDTEGQVYTEYASNTTTIRKRFYPNQKEVVNVNGLGWRPFVRTGGNQDHGTVLYSCAGYDA